MKKQTGFTLIEILVVVFIIALIASVVITAFLYPRQKGRDNQRLEDISQVAAAIMNYYLDKGHYPTPDVSHLLLGQETENIIWSKSDYLTLSADLSNNNYLDHCPRDPNDLNENNCVATQPENFGYRYVCWKNEPTDNLCRSYLLLTSTEIQQNTNYSSGTEHVFAICNGKTNNFTNCPLILAPPPLPPSPSPSPSPSTSSPPPSPSPSPPLSPSPGECNAGETNPHYVCGGSGGEQCRINYSCGKTYCDPGGDPSQGCSRGPGKVCEITNQCARGLSCPEGYCCIRQYSPVGDNETCTTTSQCCPGLSCQNGYCQP